MKKEQSNKIKRRREVSKMSAKLQRAADDAARAERKLYQVQQQKKAAFEHLKLVENEEIVRCVRKLNLGRKDLIWLLDGLDDGTIAFSEIEKAADQTSGEHEQNEATEGSRETITERPTDSRDTDLDPREEDISMEEPLEMTPQTEREDSEYDTTTE